MRSPRVCPGCGENKSAHDTWEVRVELRNVFSRNHGRGQTIAVLCTLCAAKKVGELAGVREPVQSERMF